MTTKIDRLGRIVIPKHLREHYRLKTGALVVFSQERAGLLLTFPQDVCVLCGKNEDLLRSEGGTLCQSCLSGFKKAGQ